ncbi:hypothetical protein [Streptomyces amakusaensis]|uniref:Uncharacterized protein n=1 Tax=Streptomyces amakusaensis TaxID=67271 RepID=A0ABW0AQ54_9ACTN
MALQQDVGRKKRAVASSHPPARVEADAAQAAAVPPKDDAVAQGKTTNAERMNEAKPGVFDKAAFIAAVEKAIADRAPKNLDDAEKFAGSGKAEEVKAEVQGKVGEGKESSAGEIADTTAAPPDTSAAVVKEVTPLAGDRPPGAPGAPNAASAVPDRLPPSATDLSAGPARMNRDLAANRITEAQLRKGNEPSFTGALAHKKKAERHAASAPGRMRRHEAGELSAATAGAKTTGTAAMAGMADARVTAGRRVGAGKAGAKTRDEDRRAQVTALLQTVFDTMKKDVESILTDLDRKVDERFTREEKAARDAFTAEHKREMEAYKDRRYGGWAGKARWVKDLFAGLPAEADRIFDRARENYIRRMKLVIAGVADLIAVELGRAKKRITDGRGELQSEVRRLPLGLRAIGREAAAGFQSRFEELAQSVDDKGTELVDTLAAKYTDALKAVDSEVAEEKEKNKGLVDKAKDAITGVINTLRELKALLAGVLAKAGTAIMLILADPIGFLKNLVTSVGAGLKLFLKNIKTHLQRGIMSWLLGRATAAGLQLPARFDTRGVFVMLASLLGLSWANIRARLTRRVPEEAVAAAEAAVPAVAEVRRRGVAALWDDVRNRVGDLRKDLLDKVLAYVTPTIVTAGIRWILSLLNPASAFVRAVKLIVDIVTFVVTRARQIIDFVNAVLDAAIAIARGGTGGVPSLIERALARAIPVLLAFLAALVGVGGITGRIRQIVQAMSRPVDRAVDRIIDFLVNKVKNFRRKPRKSLDGRGKGAKKTTTDNRVQAGPVGDRLTWKVETKSHRLWIGKTGGRYVPMLASEPHPVTTAIAAYRNQAASQTDPAEQNKIAIAIDRAESSLESLLDRLADYEGDVRGGVASRNLALKRRGIVKAQSGLRRSVARVQGLLGHDTVERLKKAREHFGSSKFPTKDLGVLLNIKKDTAVGVVRDWKIKGMIFRIESHPNDPLGVNTFDPTVAELRKANQGNRHKYGYSNPSKTSAEGMKILTKGLLGKKGPNNTYVPATAGEEASPAYHQGQALYRSVVNPHIYKEFPFPFAVLGHAGKGASGHWNRYGQFQTRSENMVWNKDPKNYHGPEHKKESAASGGSAEGYETPSREKGSHESWWKNG